MSLLDRAPKAAEPRAETLPQDREPARTGLALFLDFILSREPIEWSIPFALAGTAIRWRLTGASLRLDDFADRTIGIAVVRELDVAKRVGLLFQALGLLVGIVGLTLAAAWMISRAAGRRWPSALRRLRPALRPAHALAGLSVASLLFLPAEASPMKWMAASLTTVALACLLAVLRVFPRLSVPRGRTPLALNLCLCVAAWALAYSLVVEYAHRPALSPTLLATGAGLTAAALLSIRHLPFRSRWLTLATLPLVTMPWAGFLAQELGYAILLRSGGTPTFRSLVGWILSILASTSIAVALQSRTNRRCPWPAARIWSRGVLPLALAGIAVVAVWLPAGSNHPLDLFHDGEAALPAHQLVRFGALPYLDILPSHGIVVSYLGGVLQWMLDGFVAGDAHFGIGAPLLHAASIVSTYFLVRRVMSSSLFAAFAVLLLPLPFLGSTYSCAFLGLLALGSAVVRGTRGAFARLGLVLLAALLFRVDSGLMLIAVAAVILVAAGMARRGTSRWTNLVEVLGPAAAPLAVALAGLAGALLVLRPDGGDTLGVIREFLSLNFQSMSQGIPEIFSAAVPRPVSHTALFLLPAISVLLAAWIAVRQIRSLLDGQGWRGRDVVLIALAGYNLLILTRALGRHTEHETASVGGFTSAYSALLLVLLAARLLEGRRTAFAAVIAAVVLLQPLSSLSASSLLRDALTASARPVIDRPSRMSALSPRFAQPSWDASFTALNQFASAQLPGEATFVDLSHEPMLYVALDRRFPGFLIPVLWTDSERTQRHFLGRASRTVARLVVRSNRDWWQGVDGVSESIRSYRLHEFANDRFPVARSVGPFTVQTAEEAGEKDPKLRAVSLPRPAAAHHSLSLALVQEGLLLTATGDDPWVEIAIPPIALATAERVAMDLVLAAERAGAAKVYFALAGANFSEALSTSFQIDSRAGPVRYRVTSPPLTAGATIDRVRLDPPNGQKVRLRALFAGAVGPVPRLGSSELAEFTEVGKLPWLWANRDPMGALWRQGVEQDLMPVLRAKAGVPAGSPVVIAAHSILPLEQGRWPVKSAAYLHVMAKAPAAGSLSIRYGKDEEVRESGFGFELLDGAHDYLVRVSGQWAWFGDRRPVRAVYIENRSEAPVEISALDVRTGD
jgi:hypothetical protein